MLSVDELAAGPFWGGRYAAFEHEHAVVVQVAGGVLETPDLVGLGEQIAWMRGP